MQQQRLGSTEEKLLTALWLLSKVLKLFNNGYVPFSMLESE
jgi:hypothetical protein